MQTGRTALSSILVSLSAADKAVQAIHESNKAGTSGNISLITTTPGVKDVLVTLHFVFPHELLPALDLIDRKLVTQMQWTVNSTLGESDRHRHHEHALPGHETTQPQAIAETRDFFFVQSASATVAGGGGGGGGNSVSNTDGSGSEARSHATTQSTGSRFRNAYASTTKVHYEVDLQGWNCSCPAFAYSSIQLLMDTSLPNGGADTVPEIGMHAFSAEGISLNTVGGSATRPGLLVPVCKHILAVCLCQAAPRLFGHGINLLEASREQIAGWIAA